MTSQTPNPETHPSTPTADRQGGAAPGAATEELNALLAEAGLPELDSGQLTRFEAYLSLILRWNARMNLTSVRDGEAILRRHFLESITCAHALPAGVATLLDFGSGAGFPGLPIAICRPGIAVTLAESQQKKAAFLQEAVRTLGLAATVCAARAESLRGTFDCVTMRAVERMAQATEAATLLVPVGGWLALMTTGGELPALQRAAGPGFAWQPAVHLPRSRDRLVALAQRLVVG